MPPGYIPTSSQSVINEAVERMMKVVAGGSAGVLRLRHTYFVSYILLSGAHRTSTAVTKRHNKEHLLVTRCMWGKKCGPPKHSKKIWRPPKPSEGWPKAGRRRPPKAAARPCGAKAFGQES